VGGSILFLIGYLLFKLVDPMMFITGDSGGNLLALKYQRILLVVK